MINFDVDRHLGMSFDCDDFALLRSYEKNIRDDIAGERENKFYLGQHLYDVWFQKLYRCHNNVKFHVCNCAPGNFFSYVYDTFGIEKSKCSRLMNVSYEFTDCGVIKEKYRDYSYSLLEEMLSLTPEQREEVKADWTIQQVREYKKSLVATSQQDDDTSSKEKKESSTFSLRLPNESIIALTDISRRMNVTVNSLIVRVLQEYLKNVNSVQEGIQPFEVWQYDSVYIG